MPMNRIFLSSVFFCVVCAVFFPSCTKPGDNTVRQAIQAYRAGQYDAAITFFTQALEEETNYSDELLYTFISNVYVNQGEYEKAIEAQEKSLALHADYRGYVTLGMLYHLTKDDGNAVSAYQKAIDMTPEKGEAYASLGALYLGQNDTGRALSYLEKAASLEPKLAVIQANLAVAYAMTGDTEKSESALEKARGLKCENIEQFEERIEGIMANTGR